MAFHLEKSVSYSVSQHYSVTPPGYEDANAF